MDFSELLGNNSLFQGGVALGAIGGAIAALRSVPTLIMRQINRQWMVSVTIRHKELIPWISLWLSETEYAEKCRLIDATSRYTDGHYEAVIRPGVGFHMFKHEGTRFWLSHLLEDQGIQGKVHIMSIKTIGRNREPLVKMITEAVERANTDRMGKTVVFVNDKWGGWNEIRLLPERRLSSLFLPQTMTDDIMRDVNNFFTGHEWYQERGLPWRRGYLLHGPAGNGKSTIIQVLASELQMPVYMLTLSDEEITDTLIAQSIGSMPEKSILVLEDFEKIDFEKKGVTVSGLLNAIDGALASEGRLLVITANTLDAINEYFLRPGRIDRKWLIDIPTPESIKACVNVFSANGEVSKEWFIREAKDNLWSMAELQQELVKEIGIQDTGRIYKPTPRVDPGQVDTPKGFKVVGR